MRVAAGPVVLGVGALSVSQIAPQSNEACPSQFAFLSGYFDLFYSALIVGQIMAMLVEGGVPLLAVRDFPCFSVACQSIDVIFVSFLALDIAIAARVRGGRSYLHRKEGKLAICILAFSIVAWKSNLEGVKYLPVGTVHVVRLLMQATRASLLHSRMQTLNLGSQGQNGYQLVEDMEVEVGSAIRSDLKEHMHYLATYYLALVGLQITLQLSAPIFTMALAWHSQIGECAHVAMDIVDLALICLLCVDAIALCSHIGITRFLVKREHQLLSALIILSLLALASESLQLLDAMPSFVLQFVRSLLRCGRMFVLYANMTRVMQRKATDMDFAACVISADVSIV